MDILQVISYRIINWLYDLLEMVGVSKRSFPMFQYDSSACARDVDSITMFKGTYRQVPLSD